MPKLALSIAAQSANASAVRNRGNNPSNDLRLIEPGPSAPLLAALAAVEAHGLSVIERRIACEGTPLQPHQRVVNAAMRLSAPSPREMEVARLMATGRGTKVIAWELGIAARTVEVHRVRLMEKTGCRSLVEFGRLWEAGLAEVTAGHQTAPTGALTDAAEVRHVEA